MLKPRTRTKVLPGVIPAHSFHKRPVARKFIPAPAPAPVGVPFVRKPPPSVQTFQQPQEFLTPAKAKRLHIGCGSKRLPGWVNADAVAGVGDVVMDLYADFQPGEYSEIYASHVLEHVWPQETPGILRKLHNALVPGGTLRLSVPDLRLVVRNCVDTQAYGGEWSALSVLFGGEFSKNTADPDLHRQAFWKERLERLLKEAGFVRVREWGKGQYPAIDALADYATHPSGPNGKSLISLNLEADKANDRVLVSVPNSSVSVVAPKQIAVGHKTIDVSVILGTVDRPQMLRECVEAVRRSLKSYSYEIVVAYGREDDQSMPWLRHQKDVVRILGGMNGAIEAFNKAYAASRGRLICQINDDVVVDADSISLAVKYLDMTPASAGVVFKFDRKDGKGYRHEHVGPLGALHPNQMVVRRETCEAVIERIGAFWGDSAHRTDKTYGGDSAFGVLCSHLNLRLDSVPGVTCRDLLFADALREQNKRAVASNHGVRWGALYGPLAETRASAPRADEWPNLYVPRPGKWPRRSPVEAGLPLRFLHLSLQVPSEPQVDMRRAFSRIGPTVEIPWYLKVKQQGEHAAFRDILAAVRVHKPDLIWAQIQSPWNIRFQQELRHAAGSKCLLVQWTGDVRTNAAQPVDRWLVDLGHHFDLLLADGCVYPSKLKKDERVPAACGYMGCGIDPYLNPWRPNEDEQGEGVVFLGTRYAPAFFGHNDRMITLSKIHQHLPGLLTIYGSGWEETILKDIAKPFVPQAKASKIMRQAPLTIATSLYNDMSRYTSDRLKRAMASGAVVAVRRFPDMEGLGLRDRENCLMWSTPTELINLIRDWVRPEKRTQRDKIRAQAAALAHERFTWDRVTEELLAIVRDLRARKGWA